MLFHNKLLSNTAGQSRPVSLNMYLRCSLTFVSQPVTANCVCLCVCVKVVDLA